jgi:hypothetical protein
MVPYGTAKVGLIPYFSEKPACVSLNNFIKIIYKVKLEKLHFRYEVNVFFIIDKKQKIINPIYGVRYSTNYSAA